MMKSVLDDHQRKREELSRQITQSNEKAIKELKDQMDRNALLHKTLQEAVGKMMS